MLTFLACLCAHVPTFLACLRAHVPTCFMCLRAHVPTCLVCLRVHIPTCLECLRAHVPTCLPCSCAHVLTPASSRATTSNNKNKYMKTVYEKYMIKRNVSRNIYFENSVVQSCISRTRW